MGDSSPLLPALWVSRQLPIWLAACLAASACDRLSVATRGPQPTVAGLAGNKLAPAGDPPRFVVASEGEGGAARPATRLDVLLNVLHVRIPRQRQAQAEPLWSHLREDLLDSQTTLRLYRNGLRVGVGKRQWWEAVKATLDAIDGVTSLALDPMRLPPGYPLALELDRRPREQTLFFMGDDGILTGESWPQSRNVLRVSYELNLQAPDRVRLTVVPEVRQRLDGWRWVRSEAGLTPVPEYYGRAFSAAGLTVELEPDEFLLIAPGPQADLYGIVGGMFLAAEEDGQRYDSYVFLSADVTHVAQRR